MLNKCGLMLIFFSCWNGLNSWSLRVRAPFLHRLNIYKWKGADVCHGDSTNMEKNGHREVVQRDYKYQHLKLPFLSGSENYYCGACGDCFWHQNADQVLVHIPVNSELKGGVRAVFEIHNVSLYINDSVQIFLNCPERIIPHGSFWTIEKDVSGGNYIQLDLEKRYRMLNWRSLFSDSVSNNEMLQVDSRKSKVIEKLYSANRGLSKLTGLSPESVIDIVENSNMLDTILADPEPITCLSTGEATKANTFSLSSEASADITL